MTPVQIQAFNTALQTIKHSRNSFLLDMSSVSLPFELRYPSPSPQTHISKSQIRKHFPAVDGVSNSPTGPHPQQSSPRIPSGVFDLRFHCEEFLAADPGPAGHERLYHGKFPQRQSRRYQVFLRCSWGGDCSALFEVGRRQLSSSGTSSRHLWTPWAVPISTYSCKRFAPIDFVEKNTTQGCE